MLVFVANTKLPRIADTDSSNADSSSVLLSGSNHPPKKNIVDKALINIILPYSAINNIANGMAEYSTLYPATNSASASTRSNGVRFVSANEVITNNTQTGKSGKTNHTDTWLYTTSTNVNEPHIKITDANTVPKHISYEIICDAARTPPRKAYFELLLQPAKIMVCTFSDPMIRIKSIEYCNSNSANILDNGISDQATSIHTNDSIGAAMNIQALEFDVANNSFLNNLTPSAIGCNPPKIPTLLGPRLLWILPMVRRSSSVIIAMDNNKGTT
jgi:hypothetical protein